MTIDYLELQRARATDGETRRFRVTTMLRPFVGDLP